MNRTTIAGLGVLVAALTALPAAAERVYWADLGADLIQSAESDGTDVQTVVSVNEPHSVELDLSAGMIYWTAREAGEGVIGRAPLDSAPEIVLSTGADLPLSIVLDASVNKMFWTASTGSDSAVMRADLDGNNVEQLDLSPSTTPRAIALDRVNRRVYWGVQIGNGYLIRRANYDGSDVVEIGGVPSHPGPSEGASTYGVAVDALRGKVYWTEGTDCDPCDQILRADLDGSNRDFFASGLHRLSELAVAEDTGQLYWCEDSFDTGEGSRIVRADFDGANPSTVVSGLDDVVDVTVGPEEQLVPATSLPGVLLFVSVLGAIATVVLLRRRRVQVG